MDKNFSSMKKSSFADEKSLLVKFKVDRKLYNACARFCKKNGVSKEVFFSLCLFEILSDLDQENEIFEELEDLDLSDIKESVRFEFETVYGGKLPQTNFGKIKNY
jgi:hypothetical protein